MKSKQEIKAGIYARLSRDDERNGESLSIENQKLILEKYVLEQGWNLVETYVDDGYSGTTFDRPGVQRLLEDAKCGKINTIICKDLSRFGRNYIQVGQYTDYIFPMYNIRFIALNDNVDTSNNSAGMDMMPIMNIFNEWHSANTSKKIRAVIEANAKAGKYRTTYAPYGYVKGTDEKKLPIVDEPAASNVKRIFEMRASGISPKHIAMKFNDENIPIPSDYRTQKFGITAYRFSHHLWTYDVVKQILRNPTYLGHLVQLRTTNISYKNKKQIKRPDEEKVIVYNTHEPIISQELWDKVKEIERSVSQGKAQGNQIVHPLSGLMYCEDCGNKMHIGWNNTRHSRKGPRIYRQANYNCGGFKVFGTRVCTSHMIKFEDIESIVLQDIKAKANFVNFNEEQARKEFLQRQENQQKENLLFDTKTLQDKTKRLNEVTKLIRSTYEDKVLNKIPEDICISLLNNYQKEKEVLENEISQITERIEKVKQNTKNVDEFIERVKKYINSPVLTREMALELIEFITIDKFTKGSKEPRKIHIYYKLIDNINGIDFKCNKQKRDRL